MRAQLFHRCLGISAVLHGVVLVISPGPSALDNALARPVLYAQLRQVTLPAVPATAVDAGTETGLIGSLSAMSAQASAEPERQEAERVTAARLDRYFLSSELSKKPVLETQSLFDEAWRLPPQAHGRAVLTLYINEMGGVDRVESESDSELTDWLNERIKQTARFTPGMQNGAPVKSRLRVVLDLEAIVR